MENLIIEGKISGVKNSKIYLSNVEEGKIIDSTNVIDGEFKLQSTNRILKIDESLSSNIVLHLLN